MDIDTLPVELYWCTEKIQSLARLTLHPKPHPTLKANVGDTRAWGVPDAPADAAWLQQVEQLSNESYFMVQINFAQIPAEVRRPEYPNQGMLWVFAETQSYVPMVLFDPRDPKDIKWADATEQADLLGRRAKTAPAACDWQTTLTYPYASKELFPEFCDKSGLGYHVWEQIYDEWVEQHNERTQTRCGDYQIGGYVFPIQDSAARWSEGFLFSAERQPFGDSGALYVRCLPDGTFHAAMMTC